MSKIKKLLGMLVCCGILSCMLPMAAYATEGEVEFEESGYTYDQEAGTLVIHTQEGIEEFENDVENSGMSMWNMWVVSLTVEDGVTEIPADAFGELYDLEVLTFEGPISIKSDYNEATMPFGESYYLTSITFGGAADIGSGLFNSLSGITNLVFPAGSKVGDSNFCYCDNLEAIRFEGDGEVGNSSFISCNNLKELAFDGESIIGFHSFSDSYNLEKLVFGKKTTVKEGAFTYGENEVAPRAIRGNSYIMSNMSLKELTFPAGSVLKQGVFWYCRGLESITFEGDIALDGGPFSYATGLKSIVFGGTCVLKSSPFKDSAAIESITFGGAATLDNGVFMQTNVKTLDFPAGSTFLQSDFLNAPELESVIFRGDVELNNGAFYKVPKLKTLVFEGESIIGSGVFSTTTELETVTFGKKVTFTSSGAFRSSKVTELVFPEGSTLSVGTIFEETPELRKVVFEGDVVLGNAVISEAEKLEEVIFKGTSEIAAGSLYNVPKLQKLVFEKAVKLTSAAFYNAGTTADKPIESIVLPAGSEVYNWVTMANVNYIEFQDLEVPDFSYGLFSNLPTSTVIYVPCTVLEDYKAAIKTVIENAIVQDESKRINFEDLKIEGKHSYTLQKDETNHWKECACQDKIEVEAHTYGEWAVTKEPTTSEVGVKERACGVCGYAETAEIEKLQPTPTPAPTAEPTPAPTTEPETLKEMVDDLSVLVDENATKEEKVEAVKDIVEKVKEMVKDDNVAELTTSYIEEMEATIAEATGRTLNIISKDEELPTISAVAGAFLGLNPEEDGSIVFETVEEEDIPTMDEKYANGYAFDIQLFEGDDKTQPIVPVTIRMILPKSIDPNAKIVVLHYANGATTPEVLSPTVKDGAIEFTTSSFSTFVITNEVESQNSGTTGGNAGEAAPAPTAAPTPAPTPAPTEAPSVGSENPAPKTGDNANPMMPVFMMCFATLGLAYTKRTRKSEE